MGYYTEYNLNCDREELIEELRHSCVDANYAIDDKGCYKEWAKWYHHEEDLIAFSSKYCNVLFKLIGKGEDRDDIWIKYFRCGKMQICPAIITYDEFDPKKLE